MGILCFLDAWILRLWGHSELALNFCVFALEMLLSVLLALGIVLVPAHSKPAGRLQPSRRFQLPLMSELCFLWWISKWCECWFLQVNIWAALYFYAVLRRPSNSWMMHTHTPERSEFILFHKISNDFRGISLACKPFISVAQKTRLKLRLCCSTVQLLSLPGVCDESAGRWWVLTMLSASWSSLVATHARLWDLQTTWHKPSVCCRSGCIMCANGLSTPQVGHSDHITDLGWGSKIYCLAMLRPRKLTADRTHVYIKYIVSPSSGPFAFFRFALWGWLEKARWNNWMRSPGQSPTMPHHSEPERVSHNHQYLQQPVSEALLF